MGHLFGSYEIITFLSQLLKVGKAFLSQQTNRYGHFISDIWSKICLKMFTFWENLEKPILSVKITFLRFSPKVSVLDPTLLHSFNINVTIAVILVYKGSLYDAQEPRYQLSRCNGNFCKTQNLQISNSHKIVSFLKNTLKLCTLVDHYQVDNTFKFHRNQIFITNDMALQSC